MFGLGGLFNRIGYDYSPELSWDLDDDTDLGQAFLEHLDEAGCLDLGLDGFDDDDYLYCRYCGEQI